MQKTPLLSIGMIVKNEERCLEKCLKALQPIREAIPCELVIADTGSTDETVEIAKNYADILFDFTWINDFAAARNAVLNRCTGKWFMFIDADEYFNSSPDELAEFLTSPKFNNCNFATIVIRNHETKTLDGVYSDFTAFRLARRTSKLAFEGAIHERFNIKVVENIVNLTNTIFDHDGYVEVSKDFLKKKSQRNMALIEKELEKNPNDTQVILQMLDASSSIKESRIHYSKFGMEHLKQLDRNSNYWKHTAAPVARKAIQYAILDELMEVEDWILWTEQNFPDSIFVNIDIFYMCAKKYFSESNFEKTIKYSRKYLDALKDFEKNKANNTEVWFSPLFYDHEIYKNRIALMLISALFETDQEKEGLKLLETVNLSYADEMSLRVCVSILTKHNKNKNLTKTAATTLNNLLAFKTSSNNQEYNFYLKTLSMFKQIFAHQNSDLDSCRVFAELTGPIGISAKLLDVTSKKEASKLLENVDAWDEFMPLAFGKALSLKAELPESFYSTPIENVTELLNNISNSSKDFAEAIIYYTNDDMLTDFNKITFAYYLICNAFANETELYPEFLDDLISRFYDISRIFLTQLYNPEILENDNAFPSLPALHRFSIYFIMALDSENISDKIKYLRTGLKINSDFKNLISYTSDKIQQEEAKQAANAQLNANPELLQLANQVKMLLSNYAPDDPNLLAIKASPVYKQVAHLIEN